MSHILALLAKAGHGKTTIAKHLERTYGTKTVSMAGPLKRAAKAVMHFSDSQLYGTQAEKEAIDPRYGFSARTFLQRLGTEGLRDNFGPDVHVNALLQQVKCASAGAVFVIDDARFPNEVDAVVAGGGTCIKLVCTDAPGMVADGTGSGASHASERGIDMVPESWISATLVSSRALGVPHAIAIFEQALRDDPKLLLLREALENRRSDRVVA